MADSPVGRKAALLTNPKVRPTAIRPASARIPQMMRDLPQWILWAYRWKSDEKRWTKVPLNPCSSKHQAKTNDAKTWATWPQMVSVLKIAAERSDGVDGVGFVFREGGGIFGVDVDDCRDPDTGTLSDLAVDIIRRFGTYAEVSPSGTGIKLFGLGTIPGDGKGRKDPARGIEVYDRGRFFAVTGHQILLEGGEA